MSRLLDTIVSLSPATFGASEFCSRSIIIQRALQLKIGALFTTCGGDIGPND